MPLKVLHTILVDPPIAIVGLSNWVLDPAKMNRAVCLQRPDPTEDDMASTGSTIVRGDLSSGSDLAETGGKSTSRGAASGGTKGQERTETELKALLTPLAKAYHEVYTTQAGRDFIGMRDYYCLLKLLRREVMGGRNGKGEGEGGITATRLTHALCRSFGGKPALLNRILKVFHAQVSLATGSLPTVTSTGTVYVPVLWHDAPAAERLKRALKAAETLLDNMPDKPTVPALIAESLADPTARHLMCLTHNGSALALLFGTGLVSRDPKKTTVLEGSSFEDDVASDYYLVSQVFFISNWPNHF